MGIMLAALATASDSIRLSLHVLAASVWVGGQITVAGLLPTVRSLGDDSPKKIAQAFAKIEWPAFALLVITGFWNMSASSKGQSSTWKMVLGIKMAVVVAAGVAVFLHQRSKTKAALAIWGAVGSLCSVAALVMGVVLAG